MTEFSFTRISDNSGLYGRFSASSINDRGTAAFEGFSTENFLPSAILTGSGGPITTASSTSISGYDLLFSPTINNSGTTVFAVAGFRGQSGILSSSDGTVAYNNGPFT